MAGGLSRRSLLTLAGGLTMAGCTSTAQPSAATSRRRRHRYGSHPQQYGDLYLPRGEVRATVVVVHGGFWLRDYALDLGAPLSADLVHRGYAAWNVEYRRLGNGGGWPTTFTDVAVGEVVSQSVVLDLRTAAATGLGGGVVPSLLGGSPSDVPGHYAAADPTERAALAVRAGIPVRCVVGTEDVTVPASQSEEYVAAARAPDLARLVRVPGDHFAMIDPATPAWRGILGQLGDLAEGLAALR